MIAELVALDKQRERAMYLIALPVALLVVLLVQLAQHASPALAGMFSSSVVSAATGVLTISALMMVPIGAVCGTIMLVMANRRMEAALGALPADATSTLHLTSGAKAGNLSIVQLDAEGFELEAAKYGWAFHRCASSGLLTSMLFLVLNFGAVLLSRGVNAGALALMGFLLALHVAPAMIAARTRFLAVRRENGAFVARSGSRVWGMPIPFLGNRVTLPAIKIDVIDHADASGRSWSLVFSDGAGRVIFSHRLRAGDIGRYHATLIRDGLWNGLRIT